MPKALIVSSSFPPLGSAGGSIRLVKLLKYLSSWGWEFVIFTQDVQRTIVPEQVLSSFLLDELPAGSEIKRIPAPFSPNRGINQRNFVDNIVGVLFRKVFGNSALPWGIRVLWNGLMQMRKSTIDVVFSTAPPFTNALIGTLLGWVGRKPFVLDLRDDWVGLPIFFQKNIFRQKVEMLLEELIIRSSSAVITVTPQSDTLYKERYAQLGTPEKFHLVPNGCDLSEYEYLEGRVKSIVSNRFLILSAAWWYKKNHRDITPFLMSIHTLFNRRSDIKDKIDIVLLGNSLSSEYDKLLEDLKLENVIKKLNAVGREELLDWLWKADLLLLVQPVKNTSAISGTLYEYWATGKAPILLISDEGASSALVQEHHLGQHFHHDEVEEITAYIEKLFDAYEQGKPLWIDRSGIQKYDRKILAKQMHEIWQNLRLTG